MIPICRDPKRFVAALNKDRFGYLRQVLQGKDIKSTTILRRNNCNALGGAYVWITSFSSVKNIPSSLRTLSTAAKMDVPTKHKVNVLDPGKDAVVAYSDSLSLIGPRDSSWWTGKKPAECPGFVKDTGKVYSLPQLSLDAKVCSKQAIQNYFDNTWTLTEILLSSLQGEEAFMRPPYHDLRHPMIFYYGHPAALYINKLRVAGLLSDPINSYFESIFETGVDEMSWDDLSKNKMPWPSVAEVRDYRRKVYETVTKLIDGLSESQCANISQSNPLWALVMGFEHERIHLETSSFLINELPTQFIRFPDNFPSYHTTLPLKDNAIRKPIAGTHYPVNEMIEVPGQKVIIGKPRNFPSYGWDNEYGHREYDVPSFRASKYKISNGEFFEFVKDNGYSRRELWTDIGWKWRAFRNVKWPTFWIRVGPQGNHEYDMRLIFDEHPMAWNWPVCVNYHESIAFSKWKSAKTGKNYRILTEVEHRAIRDGCGNNKEDDHVMSYSGNNMAGFNTNLAFSSFSPVDAYPTSTKGFADVFGNAWEWTEDYFSPLPGFEIHPYYEDFSTPCFDGQHNIIMGGSFISTGNEASVHSRFHFRPHFHQHASFRLVEQLDPTMITSDTDAPGPFVGNYPFRRSQTKMLEVVNNSNIHSEEMRFNAVLSKHFGSLNETYSSFLSSNSHGQNSFEKLKTSIVCAANAVGLNLLRSNALEVGCGPGGLTFQLAKHVQSIIGIDHNVDSVNFANTWNTSPESWKFSLKDEGSTEVIHRISTPQGVVSKHVEFRCADPMCLPAEMKGFDLVVLNDVIDKVSAPNSVLGRMGGVRGLVRPGGLLVIVSSFNWSEERTPKSLWLGGYKNVDGVPVKAEQVLTERLSSEFDFHGSHQLPFVWHETMQDIRGKQSNVIMFIRK